MASLPSEYGWILIEIDGAFRAATRQLHGVTGDVVTEIEAAARQAVSLARVGLLNEALKCANAACDLEVKLHPAQHWRPFRELIQFACRRTVAPACHDSRVHHDRCRAPMAYLADEQPALLADK